MTELEKQLTQTIEILTNQLEKQASQNLELTEQIQRLTEQVEYLTRKLFGTSSEKTKDIADIQMSLFEDDSFFDESETTEEQTVEEEIVVRRKKPKGYKAELTKHLPVEEVHYELTEEERQCSDCGNVMNPIGKGVLVREEVHYIPAKLYKKAYYRHSYECNCHDPECEAKIIKSAPVPNAPIQRSLAGSSVIAWLCHQKFVLGIPFYRQENEWLSYGLEVSRRTLSNWMIISARDWLAPIYEILHQYLVQDDVLHADETPYQILKRSDGKPATSEARFWLFRTTKDAEKPIIYYHSDLTRKKSVAEEKLKGFKGFLHSDGYSVYQNLPNVTNVACWSHMRRKFFDICGKNGKGQARTGLEYCNDIFKLEAELKNLTPEERQERRQTEVKPIIDAFFEWLGTFTAMNGKLREAVNYAFNQKEGLYAFLENSRLQASNNLAEQKIRPIAIGRKNYLFSTSEKGATANAQAYTIIETAKANGLNAFKYLNYLFEKLPNLDFLANPELLEDFLPWAENPQLECR